MSNLLIKTAIRTIFTFTSREKALEKSEIILQRYARLADGLSREAGQRCIEVPPMRGVDEDMRKWSFFMILEHNAIVNRSITATVVQLARGEELSGAATINPKTDVMPSSSADASQFKDFADSVTKHIEAVKSLNRLRGTPSLEILTRTNGTVCLLSIWGCTCHRPSMSWARLWQVGNPDWSSLHAWALKGKCVGRVP